MRIWIWNLKMLKKSKKIDIELLNTWLLPEMYSELCQTSKMERFVKIPYQWKFRQLKVRKIKTDKR